METRRYPVDTQSFNVVRDGGYLYVDKTEMVFKMTHELRYAFLSRPRRFGKSMLCSTLEAYFNGRKDMFKGLKIEGLETEWTKYPVIKLSFASAKNVTEKSINEIINSLLSDNEEIFGLKKADKDNGVRLKNLIKQGLRPRIQHIRPRLPKRRNQDFDGVGFQPIFVQISGHRAD